MIESAHYKWIIDSTAAITQLQSTKLRFLKYEDLTYQNYLVNAMGSVNHNYERKQIFDWHGFTTGVRDLTIQDFKEFYLTGIKPEEYLLLFTDEGHGKRWLFHFLAKDFFNFTEWYENYFDCEFYDFSDYVLISPHLNKVSFNDDEGGINEFVVL